MAMKRCQRIRRHHGGLADGLEHGNRKQFLLCRAHEALQSLKQEPLDFSLQYFTQNHNAGTLELNSLTRTAHPPKSIPDCVLFFLGKGPKFVIQHRKLPSARHFASALRDFQRKLLCATHFLHLDENVSPMQQKLRRLRMPSQWWPPDTERTLKVKNFFADFEKTAWERFRLTMAKFKAATNLSFFDFMALDWLKANNFTVIKDDKGTSLIPIKATLFGDLKDAVCACPEQFARTECDRSSLAQSILPILDRLDPMLTPRPTAQLMRDQVCATWKVMEVGMTWKSHKAVQVPRVITPTTSSILTPMAHYVRIRLAPVVAKLQFVLKNSQQLVAKLEALELPEQCVFGCGDIKDFYPSTTPQIAAAAIYRALNHEGVNDASSIADLAFIILEHQFVAANGILYRCLKVGQGLSFASEACDITANELVECNALMAPLISNAVFYGRFRDDVVVILAGSLECGRHEMFVQQFNACSPHYQAIFSWSCSSIVALDLEISRAHNRVVCKTHFKPTNLFRYLPVHSAHHRGVFSSWIRAEICRYMVTCSCEADFDCTKALFFERLIQCGYPKQMVEEIFRNPSMLYSRRVSLFQSSVSPCSSPKVVALILRFNPFFSKMGICGITANLGRQICNEFDLPSHKSLRTLTAFRTDQALLHYLRRNIPKPKPVYIK